MKGETMSAMRTILVGFCTVCCLAAGALARPTTQPHEYTEPAFDIDIVGDVDGSQSQPRKALQDTIWIATWTHDVGSVCDFSGWEKVDNHILNDGSVFWDLDDTFGGSGNIAGWAAALGYESDLCCEDVNGYRNDWYQGIRIEYDDTAPADISFDYELDSEGGFDFLRVEADSACASFDRVDFDLAPSSPASDYRELLLSESGFINGGNVGGVQPAGGLSLTQFGAGTSCLYIGFFADEAFSPCDGLQPTTIGKALVIDNIVLDENGVLTSEDFEDETLGHGWTFVNMQDSAPFGPVSQGGSWARTFDYVTDNDLCTENTSCALLWTDFTTPTIASDPSMAFGPGSFVVKNWLDDIVVSPWVDLSGTPDALQTIIQFRRFPGNFFSSSRLVQNWSVRGKADVDDGMGGTVECISIWGHAFQWNSLSVFRWGTPTASGNPPASGYDMSSNFSSDAKSIQVRHRTSDWQWIVGSTPPGVHVPGPGPYIDRTRIGRLVLTGPVIDEGIDARYQAQDAFPTELRPDYSPGTGEHFVPTTDRFGAVAFSNGIDHGHGANSPFLITGDSISVRIKDVRGAELVAASVYGAIVLGPHAGQAPPPHSVGTNGFFEVPVSQCLRPWSLPQPGCGVGCAPNPGVIFVEEFYFVEFDDWYFVGGDVLQYFWLAEDALGGVTSNPVGLTAVPPTIEAARVATNGMFEVNFLPQIDWDSDYLAAVATNNKVDPNSDPAFLDSSTQRNCILYVNRVNTRRRSGDVNRTSFMYALDRLGYRDTYDVYDHTGLGDTNNHLGGRATIEQAQGYALIVYDAGNAPPGGTIMPDADDWDSQKIPQASWFVSWLAQASVSEVGLATLWVVASNALQERPSNPLYTTTMGTTLAATDQGLSINPDVIGQSSFAFDVGAGSNNVDFTVGAKAEFSLNGGCPAVRHYDAQDASVGANVYRFADPSSGVTGDAAVVMNSNPAANWNTIMMSFPYFDIREDFGQVPGSPTSGEDLVQAVLSNVLPIDCGGGGTTDTDSRPGNTSPRQTQLYTNRPNPFNPVTTIRFDLAHDARVTLRIYDVAGRLVRTLVDAGLEAARHDIVWDGLNHAGSRVPSGVYFYRLEAGTYQATRKMLLVE